jgi:hypothetical protein
MTDAALEPVDALCSYVEVLADSVSPDGQRLITYEIQAHRFILAEVNTHALLERNSASSRAVPTSTQVQRVMDTPADPFEWRSEKVGMSGGPELTGEDLSRAMDLFNETRLHVASAVQGYLDVMAETYPDPEERKAHTLHKSLLNRLLEPFMWHKMVLTMALPAENFFLQRADQAAQPEFRVIAEMMYEASRRSTPRPLVPGQWHLPYVSGDEMAEIIEAGADPRKVSVTRCGRTSTGRQHEVREYALDEKFHDSLVTMRHFSPLGHVCTPDPNNQRSAALVDPDRNVTLQTYPRLPAVGKFAGWTQWRHVIEGRRKYDSYR